MSNLTVKVTGPKRIDIDLPFPCPKCGHEFKIKARTTAPGSKVECPGCGIAIEITGDDVRELQRALDRLVSTLHSFGR